MKGVRRDYALCRFHVDKLSSAHVYLRLPRGKTLDDIPEDVLEECCQLVKQNSIQGCKENNIDIVYTKWGNLKKTSDMVVGQVCSVLISRRRTRTRKDGASLALARP